MKTETQRIPVVEGESIVVDWTPPTAEPARTAVFVPGLASNRRGEKALHFAESFTAKGWGFLTIDMRGHGDADGSIRDLTLTGLLADLAAALDWMAAAVPRTAGPRAAGPGAAGPGAAEPVLIGSSMGGAVAAWHHVLHPGATGPLALIAPSLQFPGRLSWQIGPAAMEEWRKEGVRRFESDWIELEIGFGLMEDALNYDPQKVLHGYAAPTLIFHGMKDTAVDWRTSLTFIEDCPYPHLQLVLLKNGDHRLTDHKEFLFETLWAWLAELE